MRKFLFLALALIASGCATLFYEEPPTFQQAPLACVLDMVGVLIIVPPLIDVIYGSCRMEDLHKSPSHGSL